MIENQNAVDRADRLLSKLIESQPGLVHAGTATTGNGTQAGDFIAALRDRLIAMYEKTPR